ncbi:MAG: DUF3634 family protein [Pseudomonadota bacterium]
MVPILGLIGVGVVIGVVAWIFLRGGPAGLPSSRVRWEVRFHQGQVASFEGSFPPVGWRDVQEIAQQRGTTGSVSVRADGAVVFSEGVSESDRQRYRNVLAPRATCGPGPEG